MTADTGASGRLRTAAAAAITATCAAGLLSAAVQELASARDRRRFPPPGRMVDVGARRLHLLEAGTGPPTLVVVPALGENLLGWVRMQRDLAAEMRVVLYDRGGTGWSDPPPRGRATSAGIADELHGLLSAAGIAPPYVLAAHSIGGVIARAFAARYAAEVTGLVLVDSSHEDQANRRSQLFGWPAAASTTSGWRSGAGSASSDSAASPQAPTESPILMPTSSAGPSPSTPPPLGLSRSPPGSVGPRSGRSS